MFLRMQAAEISTIDYDPVYQHDPSLSGLIADCDECTVDSNGVANHNVLTAKHHHSYSLQQQEISSNIDQEIEQ
ncbi:hypothetical protein VNO80_24469 [Phaseolus coccineus]|uniref:Uncharacterized protein n=1 Tax=Phaseolus coccineus TaxID=3886 RepID=A0AAN9LSZ9_PHACN